MKIHEGRPYASNMIANGQIQLMVIENSKNIATTGNVLEPKSAKLAHESSSLVGCCAKSVTSSKKGFREVLESRAYRHPFENVPSLLPLNPWLGVHPPPTQTCWILKTIRF